MGAFYSYVRDTCSNLIFNTSPENISENIGESHYCNNLKFENFGESQLIMVSPGFIKGRCKEL